MNTGFVLVITMLAWSQLEMRAYGDSVSVAFSSEAESHNVLMYSISPARCTASGDIFPNSYKLHILGCDLICHDDVLGFPGNCRWHLVAEHPRSLYRTPIQTLYLVVSNLFWIPGIIFSYRRRLLIETPMMCFFMLSVAAFHLCKDGAVCLCGYGALFFMDGFSATFGVLMAFVQTSAMHGKARTIAYLFAAVVASHFGYRTTTHTDPAQLVPWQALTFAVGVSFLAVRFFFLDRTRPAFRFRRLFFGWVSLLVGLAFLAALQRRVSYWVVHGSWHILAAFAGYLLTSAIYPAGFLPTFSSLFAPHTHKHKRQHENGHSSHTNGHSDNGNGQTQTQTHKSTHRALVN